MMVFGPPGSGKGTQIKLLAEKFGLLHIISSHLGKEYIKIHNDLETLRQKENYEKGFLFDSSWMFRIVKEKTEEIFKQSKGHCGIIYDGSPRTLYEAEKLYQFLSELIGKNNIRIIEISVSREELKKRIKNRLICSNSDEHVFIKSNKLQHSSRCPEGDGILHERDIDKEEIFKVRIEEYKNHTLPGLEFLRNRHDVIKINGDQSIEDVHKEIMSKMKL